MSGICSRIVFAITLAFILPLATSAAVAQDKERILTRSTSPTGIKEYWTERRMRNAQPLGLEKFSDENFNSLFVMPVPSQPGEMVQTVEPSHDSTSRLTSEDSEPASLQGKPQHADIDKWPFNTGGKLFFTTPTGDRSCSAQFVGSPHVIMTAAHCVMNKYTGKWYTNVLFVQGYKLGKGTGRLVGCKALRAGWHIPINPRRPAYDYAFLYSASKSAHWLGLKTLFTDNQFWAIGYPQKYDAGQIMNKIEGTKGTIKDDVASMTGNPFGAGSSGGAWIADLNIKKNNYVIGLNSHGRKEPNVMFSPYFNHNTYELWKLVRDGKCSSS